ncbi:hypothetical protein BKA82DRAFT_1006214 [Pisolithus tinctorius]|nr:hypothetical protein BKA82DRAFT_1006214 [Pisolithus tinctorius]
MSKSSDDVIPPAHTHRTLVLCFDGTYNQFHEDNSNVVQLFDMLKKDDPSQQVVYYQAGMPLTVKGKDLDAHILDEVGNRICLFGFSTGAYTARALAGMLHKVGLLPRCNHQHLLFAYKMYRKDDEEGWKQSTALKKGFSIDVDVEFVGVWDTVKSVGIIPRRLPFTRSNTMIRYFRHALALDEHRVRFEPNIYNRSTAAENALGVREGEKRRYTHSTLQTDSDEVWFAGCHCDVGGGSVKNGTRNKIFKAEVGILFHRSMFQQIGMDPSTLYPHVVCRPPPIYNSPANADPNAPCDDHAVIQCDPDGKFVSEEMEDLYDALSPMYDQLMITPYWWILEMLPQEQRYQREDDMWAKIIKVNMGRGRHIPNQRRGLKIHRSVKIRMEADALPEGKYFPRAKLKVEPIWMD